MIETLPASERYSDIALGMVVWNEGHRLRPLLEYLRPHFAEIVVGVQNSDDDTLDIATDLADIVVRDGCQGYGDATFGPRVLPAITAPWTFKVDGDEWPSRDLLLTLGMARDTCQQEGKRGAWIPFRSAVDGLEYEEPHSHLRLFMTAVGWPSTLHSRPMIDDTINHAVGYIRHDRSLDEMVIDYLRYLRIGRGNAGWDAHNKAMLWYACTGTAEKKGWEYVRSFPWWPEVQAAVFTEDYHP